MTEKQDYGRQPKIHDVVIRDLKWHYACDGQFMELARMEFWGDTLNYHGTENSGPEMLQLNLSILQPGALKGFHRHNLQDDVFYCWEPLLIRLYDGRLDSPTFNVSMRFVLCNQALFVPRGVSHGVRNLNSTPTCLIYTVNNFFNPEDPDEIREPWDMLDSPENSLWEMQKG